jgi:hypothetical protein
MRCQETFRGDRKSEIDNPEVGYPLQRIGCTEEFQGQEDVKKSILKFAANSALKKSL